MKKNLLIALFVALTVVASCTPGPGRQDSRDEDKGAGTSQTSARDSVPDKSSSSGDIDKSKDEGQPQ